MPTTTGNPGGWDTWQVFTTNSSGYPTGVAGTSPANNTTSSARRNRSNVTATFNSSTPEQLQFRGGDTILGSMSFGGGDLTTIDVDASGIDAAFESILSSALVDSTSNSQMIVTGPNTNNENLPVVGHIFTQKFQSRAAATNGQLQYLNRFVMSSTVRIIPNTMTYRGESLRRYSITPTKASRLPWGTLLGANQSFTNSEADHIDIISEYPLSLTTYISDGTEVTFVAGYRPVSTTVTISASLNQFAREGTAQALSSINATTGVATMAAAGSAGNLNVLVYGTRFVAI